MNVLGILSCFLLGVQAQSPEPRPSTRYRVIYSSSQAPAPIGPYNQVNIIEKNILWLHSSEVRCSSEIKLLPKKQSLSFFE